MEILTAGRGAGKTTQLVQVLLDRPDTVMIVSTEMRKRSVRPIIQMVMQSRGTTQSEEHRQARFDDAMSRVLSCSDVHRGDLQSRRRTALLHRVLIDDVDDVLFTLLGAPVDLATLSRR